MPIRAINLSALQRLMRACLIEAAVQELDGVRPEPGTQAEAHWHANLERSEYALYTDMGDRLASMSGSDVRDVLEAHPQLPDIILMRDTGNTLSDGEGEGDDAPPPPQDGALPPPPRPNGGAM